MSMLKKIWVVQDPTPASELIDIVWEGTPRDIALVAKGTTNVRNFDSWRFYDDKREAYKDAELRLKFGSLAAWTGKKAKNKSAKRIADRWEKTNQ